jgi:tetratricopeptide (TPR) repeat protein
MKNKISEVLGFITSGNLLHGLRSAKDLYSSFPDNLNIVKLLVYAYIQVGNFNKVIKLLDKHFTNNLPAQDFDYFNNMGYAHFQNEDYEKSLIFLIKASTLKPDLPGPFCSLATVYQKKHDYRKANQYIDTAIENVLRLDADSYSYFAHVFLSKSEINSSLGKDEDSIKFFKELLSKKFNENIFYILSLINNKNTDIAILKQAESYLEKSPNSYKTNLEKFNSFTPLYFGLANFYQNIDQKKSENFFDLANKEIFQSSKYNSHDYQMRIIKTMDTFKSSFLDFSDNQPFGKNNFFIVGSPRSGTTLVESIITANDEVFSGGELNSAKNLIENYINQSEKEDVSVFIKNFRETYISRTNFLRGNYEYLVDKMPENFLYLGYLLKILPNSKIIRILRNPWDIAISLYKQRYVVNVPYSSSFFNIGIFLANFEAINCYWENNLIKKDNIYSIKYEDLVQDTALYQNEIYEFIGIKPSKYNKEKRMKFFSPTASIRQIKGEINTQSVEKSDFAYQKEDFFRAMQMQREFWISKGILGKNSDFYGYLKQK